MYRARRSISRPSPTHDYPSQPTNQGEKTMLMTKNGMKKKPEDKAKAKVKAKAKKKPMMKKKASY
jgi:hypothetical protein